MSATLSEPDVESAPEPESQVLADVSMLEDKLPPWMRLPWIAAGFALIVGGTLLFFGNRPLGSSAIWSHLAYGRLIVESGSIPATEPFAPLSQGVRVIDTNWLAQVAGYLVYRSIGAPGLQFLGALSVASCVGALLWLCYRRTSSPAICLSAVGLFLAIEWKSLEFALPHLCGLVCFVALWSILIRRDGSRADWAVVPFLFVLWANIDRSFPVGLFVIASCLVGRSLDGLRRIGRITAIVRDRQVRRFLVLLELAFVGTLINPYGLGLYPAVLSEMFAAGGDFAAQSPLTLRMPQGQIAAIAVVCLLIVYRVSPRRVTATEIILMLGLGAASLWTSSYLMWWGPIAVTYFALHARATRQRITGHRQQEPLQRKGVWTVAACGLLWISFAPTPFALRILHGSDIELKQSVEPSTPIGAAAYLKRKPPSGQIFNTMECGDFLSWAGPAGLRVFMTSNERSTPAEIREDYDRVNYAWAGWDLVLDRYGIDVVVLDKTRPTELQPSLFNHDDWKSEFEDDVSIIYHRQQTE